MVIPPPPPNPPRSLQRGAETGPMAHCPSATYSTGYRNRFPSRTSPVRTIPPGELQTRPRSKEVQLRQPKELIKPLFL